MASCDRRKKMSIVQISVDPCARVQGRDGHHYCVWRNPSDREVAELIAGSPRAKWRVRAVLTEHDLYLWHSARVLHGDFVRQVGADGVRVRLQPDIVLVNQETIAAPSEFPWIFENDGNLIDMDRRREMVERWLKANLRLATFYPHGFTTNWYM